MLSLKNYLNNISQYSLSKRLLSALILLLATLSTSAATSKYDFRGAWIQTIYQGYDKRSTAENKQYLTRLLDELERAGINAVFFQVRPRSDAFYKSDIEPWSAQLTGAYGKAPSPMWDPLEFMVEEAHKRGMELHAWLNPYRGPAVKETVPASHLLKKRPELFVLFDGMYYFNPAKEDNRRHLCRVIRDILTRYDVDGIHFDDYFYPYPKAKLEFNDGADYRRSGSKLSKADWRRQNVEQLISDVSKTISEVKPWVRFGISPFGIWRNASTDPTGSRTGGLQGYDALYADVPRWARLGLIDYQIPQLYWPISHRTAPYDELCHWWAGQGHGRHIYIGQDAEKTAQFSELDRKLALAAEHDDAVQGHCWWYAASVNTVADALRKSAYRSKAIVPEYLWKDVEPASAPSPRLNGKVISWDAAPEARRWVVYHFRSKNDIDIENPEAIRCITYQPTFTATEPGVYVITALDYSNCESSPSKHIKI